MGLDFKVRNLNRVSGGEGRRRRMPEAERNVQTGIFYHSRLWGKREGVGVEGNEVSEGGEG